MKDKIVEVKSGINPEEERFRRYYQNLKSEGIATYYLDKALELKSKVLINPLIFNSQSFEEYSVDDISFFWSEDRIIGHQVITMTKTKDNSFNKPIYRKKVSKLEYYCELESLPFNMLQYYEARTNGKLESEIIIPYEKQITI